MIRKSGSRFSKRIMLKQMLEWADDRRKAIPPYALLIRRSDSALTLWSCGATPRVAKTAPSQ
jgi:hypothetical protein